MFCLFPNIQVMCWSCDNTLYKMNILENCFFQISSYSHAYVGMIYEKTKGQVPLGPLSETKGTEKRATKNAQLVLQYCYKTSWVVVLRVFPPTFTPVNNLICCQTGLMWVVKREALLFNSFFSNVAGQVARVLLHVFFRFYLNITLK